MDPTRHHSKDRVAVSVFIGVVAANFMFLSLIAHHEPVADDGWYHVYYLKKKVDNHPGPSYLISNLVKFYMNGNPRIGQAFTNLNYWPYHFHEVLTPSMIILLYFGVYVLALGRLPNPKSLYDSFLFVVVTAFCWLSIPDVGVAFFSRPIAGNYTFGACIQLLLFIPLRLRVVGSERRVYNFAFCLLMFLGGVIAGMANEHTGPVAILAYAAIAIHMTRKRDSRLPSWVIAGWVGLLFGYLALFFAPGQSKRYSGLATKTTLMENITNRGWEGNLETVGDFMIMLLPLLVTVTVMTYLFFIRRNGDDITTELSHARLRLLEVGFLVVASFGVVATTLASPLIGPRLFIAPMMVLIIAGVIVADIVSRPRKLRWFFVVGAISINLVYMVRVYVVYSTVNRESRERIEIMRNAEPGSVVRVPLHTYTERSRIYIGDDFVRDGRRALAAQYFELERIDKFARPPSSTDPK